MAERPATKQSTDWIFYGYNRCATCRKALTFLRQKGIDPQIRDIVTEGVPRAVLQTCLKQSGSVKDLFNRSGQVYRQQGLKDKLPFLSPQQALGLLSKEGRLIKRPIVYHASTGTVLIGFDPQRYKEVLLKLR